MDEAVDVVLGYGLGDALGAPDVHVVKREVPRRSSAPDFPQFPQANSLRWVVPSDKVVDDVRMPDALLDGLGVPQIKFLSQFLAVCRRIAKNIRQDGVQ